MGSDSSFYSNSGEEYGVPTTAPENTSRANSSFYAYSLPLLIIAPIVTPPVTGWVTWELGFPIYTPTDGGIPPASWVTWFLF